MLADASAPLLPVRLIVPAGGNGKVSDNEVFPPIFSRSQRENLPTLLRPSACIDASHDGL